MCVSVIGIAASPDCDDGGNVELDDVIPPYSERFGVATTVGADEKLLGVGVALGRTMTD